MSNNVNVNKVPPKLLLLVSVVGQTYLMTVQFARSEQKNGALDLLES